VVSNCGSNGAAREQSVGEGRRYRVAVDIGGTFVDAIEFDRETGSVRIAKKASTTAARPAEGVIRALTRLGTPFESIDVLIHGTTLGLNAILERKRRNYRHSDQ